MGLYLVLKMPIVSTTLPDRTRKKVKKKKGINVQWTNVVDGPSLPTPFHISLNVLNVYSFYYIVSGEIKVKKNYTHTHIISVDKSSAL